MVPSSSSIPSDRSIRSVSPSIWFTRNIPPSEHFDTNDGKSHNLRLLCIILKYAVFDESDSEWKRKYWKRQTPSLRHIMIVASVVNARPCDMKSVNAGRKAANVEIFRSRDADTTGIHTSDTLNAPTIKLEYGSTGSL